jgi:hypothetical protein
MGFVNEAINRELLIKNNGDILLTVQALLARN